MSRGRSTLCVVQARTGSTRLPGKVLQDLGGRPMLRFMLDRLADLRVDELVVATSTLDRDDAVVDDRVRRRPPGRARLGDRRARPVRDRARRASPPITSSDSPPTARSPIRCSSKRCSARHLDRGADYTSNVFPRTFPRGLDCEVMTAAALRSRARRGDGSGRARARHAVLLPPPGAVRARQHAQRRSRSVAKAGRSTPPTISRSCAAIVDRHGRRRVLVAGSVARRRHAHRRPMPDAIVLVPAGPRAQRVLPRVPQRLRRGAAQPVAAGDRPRGARAVVRRRDRRSRRAAARRDRAAASRSAPCASTCATASARSASRSRRRAAARVSAPRCWKRCSTTSRTDPQVVALTAAVHVGNTPSMRAFARVGFVPERRRRRVPPAPPRSRAPSASR